MYKVFYKDRTVFFTDQKLKNPPQSDASIHVFKTKAKLEIALNLFVGNPELKKLYVVHKNADYAFQKFTRLYQLIEAAGGLVRNDQNNILFIYRREKWDLPKGKLEKNEDAEFGALREVEEECGISNLKIKKLIEVTYHTYQIKNKNILKRTYWYEMLYKGTQDLTPQTEEEITEAKWINTDDLSQVLENTFPSILEVLEKAKVFNLSREW